MFAVVTGAAAATGAEAAVAAPAAITAPVAAVRPAVAASASLTAVKSLSSGHSGTYHAWHFALSQSGKPYEWGQTGPGGYDCSGLVFAAYKAAGFSLPRDTYEMLAAVGRALIPVSHPSTGDLAFFGSGHVELYVRPGWTYGAQKSGTPVGYHQYNGYYHPTAFFRVAGAG
jgi:peptidoglycan DL-endopeptidase CwlO